MANKNVLLIEPGYRNKYPPLGLMKIAQYHGPRGKKDNVRFIKGEDRSVLTTAWDRIYAVSYTHLGKSDSTTNFLGEKSLLTSASIELTNARCCAESLILLRQSAVSLRVHPGLRANFVQPLRLGLS